MNPQEVVIHRVEEQDLPKPLLAESHMCSTTVVYKILKAIFTWTGWFSDQIILLSSTSNLTCSLGSSLQPPSNIHWLAYFYEPDRLESQTHQWWHDPRESLRLLRTALDQVEEPGAYWHQASRTAVNFLAKWNEQVFWGVSWDILHVDMTWVCFHDKAYKKLFKT